MPITFSITCDTDEELARFLENLKFGEALQSAVKTSAKPNGKATVKKESATPKIKKAAAAKNGKSVKAAVVKPKKGPKAVTVKKPATGLKPGRKPGKLIPVIEVAIQEMVKKGKPFRGRDVTALVMKKAPDLNESSVTTGVSKILGDSKLKWEQIKDAVGRPYKLYKP